MDVQGQSERNATDNNQGLINPGVEIAGNPTLFMGVSSISLEANALKPIYSALSRFNVYWNQSPTFRPRKPAKYIMQMI